MRILSFNHHESYICSLAETGFEFDVIDRYKKLDLSWAKNSRPIPKNVRLLPFSDEVKANLKNGAYDLVVCHTVKNLLWLFPYRKPRYIFIAHIPLFFYSTPLMLKAAVKKCAVKIFKATHRFKFVAVSEFKRKKWREEGAVIVLTPQKFPPFDESSSYKKIIHVGNKIKERGEELGYPILKNLIDQGLPIEVIGHNSEIAGAHIPSDFCEYQNLFRQGRIYLYTVRYPFGDGYNTSLLEAMRLGHAIVTVANPSSPILHEVNGLVGKSASDLEVHLRRLLENPQEVDRLGKAAKATVEKNFSRDAFTSDWKKQISDF